MAMTNRERMLTLLRREKPDRIPVTGIYMGYCPLHNGYGIVDGYNNPKAACESQRAVTRRLDWLNIPIMGFACGTWEFGGEIKWPEGEFTQSPVSVRYPVNSVEDVWKLELPDVGTAGFVPILKDFATLCSQSVPDNEAFSAATFTEGPFVVAPMICSVETFSRWLRKEPKAVHHLLRLATDYLKELDKYWKDCFGTEEVLIRDHEAIATNYIISPDHFRDFAFPYIKERCEHTLELGFKTIFVHICGEQNNNLPYWKEIPFGDPGIISIGHEIDIEVAAEHFPNDIIYGNIDPSILMSGTPKEVYDDTKRIIEKSKKFSNGFIFATGCELAPNTPEENLAAMNNAVDDFGWY
jgi:uroporphyrinogen decarboxylase